MSHGRVYLLWFALVSFAGARLAHAQPSDTEVLVDAAVSGDVFEVLHGALAREGIALRRSATAAACSGALDEAEDLRARAWLSWSKRLVTLCFQDRCRSTERVLGPFAELDARAREEVITVIGAGFAALALSCPAEAPAPAIIAPEAADQAPPREAETARGLITRAEPERVQPRAAESAAVPVPPEASAPPQTSSQPSARSELSLRAPRLDDSTTMQLSDSSEPFERSLVFAARYGITRWADGVLAQYLGGGAAYALHRYPVFLGFEVNYAPPFRAGDDALSIEVSGLRLALLLWARWSLSQRVVLDAQLGPTLDLLWLAPHATTARQLRDPRSTAHADPALFVRVGPALRVYKALLVGVDLQLDAALVARSYGFSAEQAQREVFTPDRLRVSLAVHARAEL